MSRRVFSALAIIIVAALAGVGLLSAQPASRVLAQDGIPIIHLPVVGRNANDPPNPVALQLVAQGLTSPVALVEPPDGSGRLFIVDQIGLIRIVGADGALLATPFLDLRSRMVTLNPAYDERGLLGLAFHPDYVNNGRFFVYYSATLREGGPAGFNHTSRLSEFHASAADANLADPASERIILLIDEPQANHNGGTVAFSPADGYLYVSLGDGGNRDDEGLGHVEDWYAFNAGGNGQDITQNLLGSILRLDVDGVEPYAIPADNPFVDKEGLDEIYAYGFRNPYRFSFDLGGAHDLIVGDVGQELWEEINLVIKGGNYGWNVKEGTYCFDAANPTVNPTICPQADPGGAPLLDPALEVLNSKIAGGVGRAIVGGYIYRGSVMTALQGQYLFGMWNKAGFAPPGTGLLLLAERRAAGPWRMHFLKVAGNPNGNLAAFLLGMGQDRSGEVYALTTDNLGPAGNTGKVFKIIPVGVPSVTVEDQPLVNAGITIPQAISAGPGWLVIHAQQNGAPGPVIGHSAVSDGANNNVAVQIALAGATATLHAMLHIDAGQVGVFEFPGPDAPAQAGGQVVSKPFTLQVPQQEATVSLRNVAFNPETLVVLAGATVTWVNEEALPHTTTSDTGLWNSGLLAKDASYSRVFGAPGVYPYYCVFHGAPGGIGMSGTIIVIQ